MAHAPPAAVTSRGGGPRHLALHPTRPLAFVLAELTSTIDGLQVGRGGDGSIQLGLYPMLPDGFSGESSGAEIEVHANGRFLYASNRGPRQYRGVLDQ